jgi:hypothetical protein
LIALCMYSAIVALPAWLIFRILENSDVISGGLAFIDVFLMSLMVHIIRTLDWSFTAHRRRK